MDTLGIERRIALVARRMTLLAVLASSLGALLMIVIGLQETVMAFRTQVVRETGGIPAGDATAIHLISALDRFLMSIVLLYFAFGIYVLFVRPGSPSEHLGIPPWLRVEGIGQLKQTLAEVIVVVLFVLFLRLAVETFVAQGAGLSWPKFLGLITLPISIFLLAGALKLAELHPKSK